MGVYILFFVHFNGFVENSCLDYGFTLLLVIKDLIVLVKYVLLLYIEVDCKCKMHLNTCQLNTDNACVIMSSVVLPKQDTLFNMKKTSVTKKKKQSKNWHILGTS